MISNTVFVALLLYVLLHPIACQTLIRKISFPKHSTPDGWERFNETDIYPADAHVDASDCIHHEYRGYIQHPFHFTYSLPIPEGAYMIRFGLLETVHCVSGGRVFRFTVGKRKTSDIDIFKTAGCNVPYVVQLGVNISRSSPMLISAEYVSGSAGPSLSNLQIFKISRQNADVFNAMKIDFAGPAGPAPGYSLFNPDYLSPKAYDLVPTNSDYPAYQENLRRRPSFSYVQPIPNGNYSLRLGFLEFGNGCSVGSRVFSVMVGDRTIRNVDVFNEVGCMKPYDIWLRHVAVTNGQLPMKFSRTEGFAPFISNFEIQADSLNGDDGDNDHTKDKPPEDQRKDGDGADEGPPTIPRPSEPEENSENDSRDNAGTPLSKHADRKTVDIEMDVGPEGDVDGTERSFHSGKIRGIPSSIPASYFKSSRYGKDFTLSFPVSPGAYDITLGFVEAYRKNCNEQGKRVFSVYVNGAIQLEGYDIYEQVGCYQVQMKELKGMAVGVVNPEPLTIRFLAVSNFAQVTYIRVKSASDECVPTTLLGEFTSDHGAHAVPGAYPRQDGPDSPLSFVVRGDKVEKKLTIDGSSSHTHFFDSETGKVGRITRYVWTIPETGQILSDREKFSYKFPRGTTRIKLSVMDNSCATDEAETTVSVSGEQQNGQVCYFYPGLSQPLSRGTYTEKPLPSIMKISKSLDLTFPESLRQSDDFMARCIFSLDHIGDPEIIELSVSTGGSGVAKVFKGDDLILDTSTFSTTDTPTATGLTAFEVIYVHKKSYTPELAFRVNGKVPSDSLVWHDQSDILPIITSIDPPEGRVSGDTRVKVTGYGLYSDTTIRFGSRLATLDKDVNPSSGGVLFLNPPEASSAGTVSVQATSANGLESNMLEFTYGEIKCGQPAFQSTTLRTKEGRDVDLKLPTCATLGPDGRIYVGTLGGTIQVLGYDVDSLKATTQCSSDPIRDPSFKNPKGDPATRDILGIAFNPQEKEMLPYVSTSTTYWYSKSRIDRGDLAAWRNGAVDRMKVTSDPGSFKIGEKSGICIKYDRRIVSNLPVSNRDHSVNALLFTQNGDLLIAVGGNTNAGLPGWKLGNLWETHLSASLLIAKLSRGLSRFDGNIQYSNENIHHLAKKISGDVDIYAAGMRNMFALTMTQSEEIYATDNGPNCSFGEASVECDDYDPARANDMSLDSDVDWQSSYRRGNGQCGASPGRRDKVLHIEQGKFYGHPNIQRGDSDQCAWIDPKENETLDGRRPPGNYKSEVVAVDSAATGIGEYGASHFCGKLRGELILSTYKSGTTWRVKVSDGKLISGPDVVMKTGGIQFVEDIQGNLIFPQLSKKKITVLKPTVTKPEALAIVGVWPRRHWIGGGSTLYIGGYHFGSDASVSVGGSNCNIVASSEREIKCVMAKLSSGSSKLVDVKVESNGATDVLVGAVLYTNI